MAISFITLGELRYWGYKRKWAKKRWDDLAARLRSTIIVPYDDAVCDVYAELKADLSVAGVVVENNDLWIAACAVRHSLTLITNNRSHFARIPRLAVISEDEVVREIQAQRKLELDEEAKPATVPEPPSSH